MSEVEQPGRRPATEYPVAVPNKPFTAIRNWAESCCETPIRRLVFKLPFHLSILGIEGAWAIEIGARTAELLLDKVWAFGPAIWVAILWPATLFLICHAARKLLGTAVQVGCDFVAAQIAQIDRLAVQRVTMHL